MSKPRPAIARSGRVKSACCSSKTSSRLLSCVEWLRETLVHGLLICAAVIGALFTYVLIVMVSWIVLDAWDTPTLPIALRAAVAAALAIGGTTSVLLIVWSTFRSFESIAGRQRNESLAAGSLLGAGLGFVLGAVPSILYWPSAEVYSPVLIAAAAGATLGRWLQSTSRKRRAGLVT